MILNKNKCYKASLILGENSMNKCVVMYDGLEMDCCGSPFKSVQR